MAPSKSIKANGPLVNVSTLNYLPHEDEVGIVTAKVPQYANKNDTDQVAAMVRMADLTRKGFMAGDLSTVMSPRTVITWAESRYL